MSLRSIIILITTIQFVSIHAANGGLDIQIQDDLQKQNNKRSYAIKRKLNLAQVKVKEVIRKAKTKVSKSPFVIGQQNNPLLGTYFNNLCLSTYD